MPVASIILGIVALLFMIGGFLMTGVPVAGAVLSFGAPLSALVGIVLAGISMSRAKREGVESGAAVAGLVVNIIAFILGLAVALTCGLCNVCFSASTVGAGAAAANNPFLQPQQGGGFNTPNNPNDPNNPFGQLGQQLAGEMSRLSLTMTLASAQLGCAGDPTGAQSAATTLHPSVVTQYQGVLCTISESAHEAFSRGCDEGTPCSTVTALSSTPDANKATAVGLDATQCFLYQSGQARIIGCNTGQDYRILALENVNAITSQERRWRGGLSEDEVRLALSSALLRARAECEVDQSGARAVQVVMHPSVSAPQYQQQICQLGTEASDAFTLSCDDGALGAGTGTGWRPGQAPCSVFIGVEGSPDAIRVQTLGIDPALCFASIAGRGKLVVCHTPDLPPLSMDREAAVAVQQASFRLIHLENVAAI